MYYTGHRKRNIAIGIIVFLIILYFINAVSFQNNTLLINFNLKIIHLDHLTTFGFLLIFTAVIIILYVIISIITDE